MNATAKFVWRAAKGQTEAEQALYRMGTGTPKSAQKQMVAKNMVNNNIVGAFLTGKSWETQKTNVHWDQHAKFLESDPNPKQSLFDPKNKELLKSTKAYLNSDTLYVQSLGQVTVARLKAQKDLTPEEQKERDDSIAKYNKYAQALITNNVDYVYKGDGKAFDVDIKSHPLPAAEVYMRSLIQVAESGNFQLSIASQIPCIVGWSKMSQYLYQKYNLKDKDIKGTVFFELYLKPSLSTAKPVDDSTYLDPNGIEWLKHPDEKVLNAPMLSESARRLIAGIQAGIDNGTITYPMYVAMQRDARIFCDLEAQFAEYAMNPSQKAVDQLNEMLGQAINRPRGGPSIGEVDTITEKEFEALKSSAGDPGKK